MNLLDNFHHWRRRRRWNKQYRKGRWESLKKPIEKGRYDQIVAYINSFGKTQPSILDIGCGDGVLNSYLKDVDFKRFLGVDFSSVSIDKAKAHNFPNAEFEVADIISFRPKEQFDIIIFNEAFYYIPETEKSNVLNLMTDHLTSDGIFITSIYREGVGCWEYFKEDPHLREEAFTTITTDQEKTYWKIGVYRKMSG